MEHGIYIILAIPIVAFFGTLGYQLLKLIYLWFNLKISDFKLWWE